MQKITINLWLQSSESMEKAVNLYTSLFNDSKITSSYKTPVDTPGNKAGDLLTIEFELAGQKFVGINGGPAFSMNPSISLFVECETEDQVDTLYNALSQDGNVLMPLQKYDFSEKYAWVQDQFGLSWQFHLTKSTTKICPSLLFTGKQFGKVGEAIELYTSLFPDSKKGLISRYEDGQDKGKVDYSEFELAGQKFIAMESSMDHKFSFNEGVSIAVSCRDQEEVDKYWNALTSDGGEESMCGWLKDKFGVSWQIVPVRMNELLSDPDPEKAKRAMNAMLEMKKINVSEIEKAVNSQQ